MWRAGLTRTIGSLALALALTVTAPWAAGLARGASTPDPYFSAPFRVQANAYTFGQTPSWTSTGDVLSNEPDRSGLEQVYNSKLDGSRRRCETCGRLQGPNGFAEQQPQAGAVSRSDASARARSPGRWILFCSMGAQPEHYGQPCLGGYGSDLYVMRPDGSRLTRLTRRSESA